MSGRKIAGINKYCYLTLVGNDWHRFGDPDTFQNLELFTPQGWLGVGLWAGTGYYRRGWSNRVEKGKAWWGRVGAAEQGRLGYGRAEQGRVG